MSRRGAAIALAAILAIALVLRVVIAYAMPSQCWPDEIFQSLEQAHRIVFGRGVIPWEFVEGTRSWVFPGALAGVMKASSVVSSSVTVYLLACATVLSAISLTAVWAAFRWGEQLFGLRGAIVTAGTCTLWYELVYFAPKAMCEVVAGGLLAAGVLFANTAARAAAPSRRDVIAGALLLSLCAMLRIQLAPAAGICFVYMLARAPWRLRGEAIAAAVGVALVFGLVDAATWGYPFASYVGNIRANLIEGRSRDFGVAPWYAYFQCYALLWGPVGLAILALAAIGARRAPLAAVTAIVVLLAHLPIAHKEYRFLFPALVLVIMLAGIGLAEIVEYVARRRDARTANLAAAGVLVIVLTTSLTRANHYLDPGDVFALGPKGHPVELWSERRGYLLADRWISEQPDVCGVALVALHWSQTGGYTYMHKDVPLLEALSSTRLEQITPYVNVLLARPDMAPQLGPFTRLVCWNTACVYWRSGTCSPIDAVATPSLAGAY